MLSTMYRKKHIFIRSQRKLDDREASHRPNKDVNLTLLSKLSQMGACVCCQNIHGSCGTGLHCCQGYSPLRCAWLSKVTVKAKVNISSYQTGKKLTKSTNFLTLWTDTIETLLVLFSEILPIWFSKVSLT